MGKIKEVKIKDLVQDNRNLNKGTEQGRELIQKSLREFGAGRSILIDKNNRIIAGNKTHENAEAAGLEDAIIVETDGTKLVAVKRTDVDLDTKQGREMALADNATVHVDLEWDTEQLNAVADDFGIDTEDWGFVDIEVDDGKEKLSDQYSQKIGQVIYEPKQTNHRISDLYEDNSTKFDELINQIENEELKKMLRLRAAWFVDFDFAKVADYYAYQATPEEQRVMEALGLVLLDLDGLIANGFSDLIADYDDEENH